MPTFRSTGFTCAAILLFSLPAHAGTTAKREPATIALRLTGFGNDNAGLCAVPSVSLPALAPSPLVQHLGEGTALKGTEYGLDQNWALSLQNRWQADVNHFMEHAVLPTGGVKLHVTQTSEDVPAGSEPEYRPNSTLGAIELVIR